MIKDNKHLRNKLSNYFAREFPHIHTRHTNKCDNKEKSWKKQNKQNDIKNMLNAYFIIR